MDYTKRARQADVRLVVEDIPLDAGEAPTMVHLVNGTRLRDNLRQDVEDKIGAFTSSFLAANPR